MNYDETRNFCNRLVSEHSERTSDAQLYRRAYMLDSDVKRQLEDIADHVKVTVHPLPRVSSQGVKRLMTATEATFGVDNEDIENADEIEEAVASMWWKSGQVNGAPLEEDAVLSMIIYDEIHIGVSKTADLVAAAAGLSGAELERIKRLAEETPYLFEVYNPESGYPVYDRFGMRAYYRETTVTADYIRSVFGNDGERVLAMSEREVGNAFDEYTLCDYYDLKRRTVWVKEADNDPLIDEEHKLPFIPVVCVLGEGSRSLFHKHDEQRQPHLYTLLETKLWDRLTLFLSANATNVTQWLGVQFIQEGDGEIDIQFNKMFGAIKVPGGNSIRPLGEKGVIDSGVMAVYGDVQKLAQDATVYPIALGGAPERQMAFSSISLLSQQGRLPLVTIQRQTCHAMAEAVQLALRWMVADKGKYKGYGISDAYQIAAKDIPEYVRVEAKLEIDLPQDKLGQAGIVNQLAGKLPMEYLIENILGEGQPGELMKQTMSEEVFRARLQIELQRMQQEAAQQAQQQAMQQQAMQQAAMQQQGPPPGPGGQIPPEMQAALTQGAQGEQMPTPNAPPMPTPGGEL